MGSEPKMTDDHPLIAERRRKLDALRGEGFAFPNGYRRTALAGEIHATYGEQAPDSLEEAAVEVSVGGRIMAKRVMGKASFASIRDRSGDIQLFIQRDAIGKESYKAFRSWDMGDIAWARGNLFFTRTGELSVRVVELVLLTKSLRPLPEKFHGLSDTEIRYRRRYVDLIVNESSRDVFEKRSRIIQLVRSFLDTMDFLEVETPMMHPIPGGAIARPFVTHHNALDREFYLRIAPELYLKRLTIGGFERVYEINRSFRNEGVSTQHNPEFTMLELYMAYADYEDLMALLENLVRRVAEGVFGTAVIEYQGREYDFSRPFRRIRLEDAICERNGGLDRERIRDVEMLTAFAREIGLSVGDDWDAGKLQLEIFEKTVEDELLDPTFVTDYPASVSPLSRRSDDDQFLVDRFELFIAGRELANGFSELNDPEDQAERFRAQAAQKSAGDHEAMYFDGDYVEALEYGLPPTAGLGVGIDRLVMLMTDSPSIRDVLLFPHLRAES